MCDIAETHTCTSRYVQWVGKKYTWEIATLPNVTRMNEHAVTLTCVVARIADEGLCPKVGFTHRTLGTLSQWFLDALTTAHNDRKRQGVRKLRRGIERNRVVKNKCGLAHQKLCPQVVTCTAWKRSKHIGLERKDTLLTLNTVVSFRFTKITISHNLGNVYI